jgi:membrane-bound lytic murein transglycosylase F
VALGRPKLLREVALACSLAALAGCDDDIDAIRAQGELIVLTRNAPTTYYEGREGLEGPEQEMAAAFAAHLGVKPRFLVLDTVAEILDAVSGGEGHVAAAGLTVTEQRQRTFHFGPPYKEIRQELVCHRDGPRPETVEDLVGLRIAVIAESSYQENLERLSFDVSGLDWEVATDVDTEELLQRVADGDLDCTIADSNIAAINQRYHPELVIAFAVSETQKLAWIVSERAKALEPEIKRWFATARKDGRLADIDNRYYGYIEVFDYVDASALHQRIEERLPRYRPIFEKAAKTVDLPWDLLAAVSYQESHWNPKAKSPTGVRGIMMLTRNTARELGVKNRLDPVQSIRGGARYLKDVSDRLPDTITGDDRIWIGLAAYNVGLGHISDARDLAKRLDHDPDTWAGLREVLPLLSKKRYHKTLKHGYARGNEPVRFVKRVRNYQDILSQQLDFQSAGP